MIQMINPYTLTGAPIWNGYVRQSPDDNLPSVLVKKVTLNQAKEAVGIWLEEHFPGQWQLEDHDTDFSSWSHYYHVDGAYLRQAYIEIQSDIQSSWVKYQRHQHNYEERMEKKASEMFELLRELAPNDKRVLDIIGYVEPLE